MILNLDKSLKKEYFNNYTGQDVINLEESNSGVSYTFSITSLNGDNMYSIFNIEKLKRAYLIEKNVSNKDEIENPKDCDYILIDDNSKIIFYIELKLNSTGTSQHIAKQIESGRLWLEHFLFCSNVDISELSQYTEKKVCLRYDEDARVSKSRPLFTYKDSYDFHEFRGRTLKYTKLKNSF